MAEKNEKGRRIPTGTAGVYRVHRTKGDVFVARWRDKAPATGKPRVRSKTFSTHQAAKNWLSSTKNAQLEGTYVDPNAGRVTFREVTEQWLATADSSDARPQTVAKYRANLTNYALPTFGGRQIASIRAAEINDWLRGLRTAHGKPPMPATLRRAYFPLRATFAYAERHDLIAKNPCQKVTVPDRVPTGRAEVVGRFLTLAQVDALATEVAKTHPVYGLLVRFAAGVGLRSSELAGLRIRDVNLAKQIVRVEQTAKNVPGEGWVIDKPKSKTSKRTVPISYDLLEDLRAYLAAHPRRNELDAPFWPGRGRTGLDYGSAGANHYWDASIFYRRVYRPAVAIVGLPAAARAGVRFHDLRHTCGSQWLQDGISMFKVSRWLGHSNIAFTCTVYGHLAEDPDHSADMELIQAARRARATIAG